MNNPFERNDMKSNALEGEQAVKSKNALILFICVYVYSCFSLLAAAKTLSGSASKSVGKLKAKAKIAAEKQRKSVDGKKLKKESKAVAAQKKNPLQNKFKIHLNQQAVNSLTLDKNNGMLNCYTSGAACSAGKDGVPGHSCQAVNPNVETVPAENQ